MTKNQSICFFIAESINKSKYGLGQLSTVPAISLHAFRKTYVSFILLITYNKNAQFSLGKISLEDRATTACAALSASVRTHPANPMRWRHQPLLSASPSKLDEHAPLPRNPRIVCATVADRLVAVIILQSYLAMWRHRGRDVPKKKLCMLLPHTVSRRVCVSVRVWHLTLSKAKSA